MHFIGQLCFIIFKIIFLFLYLLSKIFYYLSFSIYSFFKEGVENNYYVPCPHKKDDIIYTSNTSNYEN